MKIKHRALLLLAPAILGLGALTACSDSAAPEAKPDLATWQLAMNKCMTDKGMAPQVKQVDGGGTVSAPPAGVDPAAYEQAGADCVAQIGDPPVEAPSAEEQAELQKAKLAFYKCLQDAGYDVATPAQGSPGMSSGGADLSGVPSDVVTTCGRESGY